MSKSLIFYTNPMSRGQIIRWMLEEVGAPYDTKIMDYGAGLKDPAYLAINPMGKVPAIQHGDQIVTECAAICAYLADAFPDAGLAPPLADRAAYYRWLFFAAGPLEQAIFLRQMGQAPDAAQQRSAGFGHYDLTVDVLEQAVAGRRTIAGDQFTAADVYVGSHIDWGLLFGTLPSRPAFEDYIAALRTRPAYQRAKAIDNALIAQMQPPQA